MPETLAAIGFKPHTGWVAFVAVAGMPGSLEVFSRGRAALLPADESIPRFVYHEAGELDSAHGHDLVGRAKRAARELAGTALSGIIDDLRSHNAAAQACAVITGSSRIESATALSAISSRIRSFMPRRESFSKMRSSARAGNALFP